MLWRKAECQVHQLGLESLRSRKSPIIPRLPRFSVDMAKGDAALGIYMHMRVL